MTSLSNRERLPVPRSPQSSFRRHGGFLRVSPQGQDGTRRHAYHVFGDATDRIGGFVEAPVGAHDNGAGLNLLGIGDDGGGRTRRDHHDRHRTQIAVSAREQRIEPLAGFTLGPTCQFGNARQASLGSGAKREGIVEDVNEMQPGAGGAGQTRAYARAW